MSSRSAAAILGHYVNDTGAVGTLGGEPLAIPESELLVLEQSGGKIAGGRPLHLG